MKRRLNYDPNQIVLAYKEVMESRMSIYKVARVFGVPESTLRDRHLGIQPVDHVPSHGPKPVFTRDEENLLVNHVSYMSNIGYSRQAFLDIANEFAVILGKKSGDDPTFKGSWYEGFKKGGLLSTLLSQSALRW